MVRITKTQTERLKKHSKGHSLAHMSIMKREMRKGASFSKAHKFALRVTGK